MAISPYASSFVLPIINKPYPTILDFICQKFPRVSREIWIDRIKDGKVHYKNGDKVYFNSKFRPHDRIFYYREVENEVTIPFEEKILFENEHFIIVDKPHFLPVIPAGNWVEETLINRLRKKLGNDNLIPINRIDRETAGLIMISKDKETRDLYQALFRNNKVYKEYESICIKLNEHLGNCNNIIKNRLVKGDPWFRMKIEEGNINAESFIEIKEEKENLFKLKMIPKTGKKHQLRIHINVCGYKILNDRCYPVLLPQIPVDYKNPLQLLAKKLSFYDPILKKELSFESKINLRF